MVYIGATFTCNNYIVFSFSFKIYFYHLCKLNENKGHLSLRIPHPIQLSQIFSIFINLQTHHDISVLPTSSVFSLSCKKTLIFNAKASNKLALYLLMTLLII